MIWLALATSLLQDSNRSDLAVTNVLKRLDRSVADAIVWHRVTLTGEMDLVLAIGRPSAVGFYDVSDGWFGWDSRATLGFFLQEHSRPERVYVLAIEPGGGECGAHILRATASDIVISCGGEKSEVYPNQKFVYDVRAKRLVSRFAYEPFSMSRAKPKKDGTGAVITGSDGSVQVQVDFQPDRVPEFKVVLALSH